MRMDVYVTILNWDKLQQDLEEAHQEIKGNWGVLQPVNTNRLKRERRNFIIGKHKQSISNDVSCLSLHV